MFEWRRIWCQQRAIFEKHEKNQSMYNCNKRFEYKIIKLTKNGPSIQNKVYLHRYKVIYLSCETRILASWERTRFAKAIILLHKKKIRKKRIDENVQRCLIGNFDRRQDQNEASCILCSWRQLFDKFKWFPRSRRVLSIAKRNHLPH